MIHYRVAERGKMHALDKNYKEALRHYKEAMKMLQQEKDSELFFQHYSQCVMETLELSGAHDQVIDFCENYRNFLKEKEQDVLVRKHNAFVCERQAIQHVLREEQEEAKALLQEVQKDLGRGKQPITDELLGWLLRGYKVNRDQLTRLQKKHNYFIVRKESINPKIAMDLPEGISPF